ncbi:MAG: HAMP domain-containing sensor histidine kinase [Bacillota bacterium]
MKPGDVRDIVRRLREENERLLRTSRLKDEFLASISHELRTPLTSIIGFAELLLDDAAKRELGPREREYVGLILESSRQLLAVVNDLLDIAKIEAGKMELHRKEFALSPLLEECLAMFREKSFRQKIILKINVPGDVGTLTADPRRVKQVVCNLLANALRFTPAGGRVTLTACRRAREVEISVRDTGPGIPPEYHDRIFNAFEQVYRSLPAGDTGTGLGLAIARRLVELHGGRIWVESQPGQGSCFYFTLPVQGTAPTVVTTA